MQIVSSRFISSGIVLLLLLLTTGIGSADEVSADLISRFGGPVQNVAVDGNYAYIGQGEDLVVLDITDVSSPSEVGRLVTPSEVESVTVAGNYAYVVSDGLMIVNISDPTFHFAFICK